MTRGDVADKLRILFEIHVDLEDELLREAEASPTKSDITEIAEEAAEEVEEGFELNEGEDILETLAETSSSVGDEDLQNGNFSTTTKNPPGISEICQPLSALFPNEKEIPEIVILEPSKSPRQSSAADAAVNVAKAEAEADSTAHVFRDPDDYRTYRPRRSRAKSSRKISSSISSPASLHSLPPLNQRGFIEFLKTLYDMTSGKTRPTAKSRVPYVVNVGRTNEPTGRPI